MSFILALALSIAVTGNPKSASKTTPQGDAKPPVSTETKEKIPIQPPHVEIWEAYYHAKINWRYHLAEAGRWSGRNRTTTAAVVILGFVSFAGPFVFAFTKDAKSKFLKYGFETVWVLVGTIAMVVSSLQLIWPYSEWATQHKIQASRWSQVAGEWHELYQVQSQLDPKQVREQIALLNRATSEIENDEPLDRFDEKVMAAAEDSEDKYQGQQRTDVHTPDTQASI